MSDGNSKFYRWDEAAACFVDEANNAWSATGEPGTWHPRIGNPQTHQEKHEMAKKLSKAEVKEAVKDATAYPDSSYDPVTNPAHYTQYTQEVWDTLDEWFPDNPLLWMTGKYLARATKKGDYLEQIEKAHACLARAIMKERKRRGL